MTDSRFLAFYVRAEHRLGDDRHRDLEHLLVEINLLRLRRYVPGFDERLRFTDHDVRVSLNPFGMKGGLQEFPLLFPVWPISIERAVPDDLADYALLPAGLVKAIGLIDQDVTNVIRVIEEIQRKGAKFAVANVAISSQVFCEG